MRLGCVGGAVLVFALWTWGAAVAQQSPTPPRDRPGLDPGGRGGLGGQADGRAGGRVQQGGQQPGSGGRGGPTAGGGAEVQGQATGGEIRTVTSSGGGSGRVRVQEKGNFEPFRNIAIEFGAVPGGGEPMTLQGPSNGGEFLQLLSIATNWNILATQAAQQVNLQFWINEMTPDRALEVLRFNNLYYEYDADTEILYVMTQDEYLNAEYGAVNEAEFRVHHTDVADAEQIVTALMSPRGKMIVDPRTGQMFVYDTASNLLHMEKALRRLDVPMETRSVPLQFIDAENIVESVESMLSERGTVQVDPRSNTLIIRDMVSRQEEITRFVGQLDQELETRTWRLDYADPLEVADLIAEFVPEEMGAVTVNEPLHQVSVTAIPSRLNELDKQITLWDRQRPQVQIEAYLVSMNNTLMRDLGIDWAYFETVGDSVVGLLRGGRTPNLSPPGTGQRLSVGQLPEALNVGRLNPGGTIPPTAPVEGLDGNPIIRDFRGDNLSVVLNYLEDLGHATIHTHPRVTVQDGEEAVFENVTQVPFVTASTFTPIAGDAGGAFVNRAVNQIDFVDVGTVLTVLPRITEDKSIVLGLGAEESTFVFREVIGQDQISTVPEKSQNRAETIVEVANGQTIVIGGLRTSNVTNNVDKIPFLGDLPLFGRFFKTTSKEHSHNDLLIFLTPTVVNEYTHPEAQRLAQSEEEVAETYRHESKGAFGRLNDRMAGGKNEIMVSIGQQGDLHAAGSLVTLDDLRAMFAEPDDEKPFLQRVVIRRHPRAPEAMVLAVTELALGAELKVELDDRFMPFVPHYETPPE